IRRLLQNQERSLDDFDAVEINEAFAAQVLACTRELEISPDRINACGGAIAVGHPIGASGARLVVHLAHRIQRGEARRAVGSLCVGGGMGIALSMETPS
ncbi:MAG TPA: acetyl-CoA C-acyltransferase, partial [Bacteroidia bacterium]|nr:acetyl-CoA C-acyltransferase [Bacteroidia bacterium]